MVTFPSRADLKKLQNFKRPFCTTIYIPPEDTADANQIALKNMLRRAEGALAGAGANSSTITKTLEPVRALNEAGKLWPAAREGLTIFASPKLFRHYQTPVRWTPNLMLVGQGFLLNPILDAMYDDARYYLLALSHNHVLLFEGSHYEIHPIHPKDLPENMKEALRIDEYPSWQSLHEVGAPHMGKLTETYHSQYNVSQTDKAMLVEFFQHINKHLRHFLRGGHTPLIIGGVEYLLPLYRQANTYPYLVNGSIKGNLERTKPDELRDRAWKILRSVSREHAAS